MNLYKKLVKKPLKKLGETKFVMGLISSVLFLYAKFVGLTTRWHTEGIEEFHRLARENNGVILVIWHGRALMLPFFKERSLPLDALVSLHRDGRMIAGLLKRFHIGIIGGSTNENAKGGALDLMRTLKQNTSICIIPDGPRGPRMIMGRSPVYYAQKTGKPIIGGAYSIQNAKIIEKAWDKMMVPFPFSRGVCKISQPLYVPENATDQELEQYRREMERRLNKISIECDQELGRAPVLPDAKAINPKRRASPKTKTGNKHVH